MVSKVSLPCDNQVIALASEVTYLQKPYWCNCSSESLKISVMRPRSFYPYDPSTGPLPCIVFFCGGAFQKQDRNVWLPELVFFAKHGYTVATVDYSTHAYTRYPEALSDAKAAVRFLRSHAHEFQIDPDRIAAMGESAGGQIACWLGTTGDDTLTDHAEVSSRVQCCVALYPVTNATAFPAPDSIRIRMDDFPDTAAKVNKDTPPFFLVHGTKDSQVPYSQSVRMYDALQKANIPSDLLLIEGADHADPRFYSDEVKKQILAFLDRNLG